MPASDIVEVELTNALHGNGHCNAFANADVLARDANRAIGSGFD